MLAEWLFWTSAACIAWCYVGYPVLIAALARATTRRGGVRAQAGRVSVILAVHNEQDSIARRIDEFVGLLGTVPSGGEILVVSDGSTDATVALARERAMQTPVVRVIELESNQGKAAALTRGAAEARGDFLVFADARQRWAPDALSLLLDAFDGPEIGAVSGDVVLTTDDGANAGVGLYWRYEKWIRTNEARVHSTVGVSGAISAVRRELFHGIPKGMILDDLYWPLEVVLGGHRVAREDRAIAFDRLPPDAHGEFRRKVRTLTGNFQLVARRPRVLNPVRNPVWFQFVCHKLLRLVVPWALLAMLVTSGVLAGPLYRTLFILQLVVWALAAAAIVWRPPVARTLFAAAAAFLMLNAAAWVAFWIWASGRSESAWRKVQYSANTD